MHFLVPLCDRWLLLCLLLSPFVQGLKQKTKLAYCAVVGRQLCFEVCVTLEVLCVYGLYSIFTKFILFWGFCFLKSCHLAAVAVSADSSVLALLGVLCLIPM